MRINSNLYGYTMGMSPCTPFTPEELATMERNQRILAARGGINPLREYMDKDGVIRTK